MHIHMKQNGNKTSLNIHVYNSYIEQLETTKFLDLFID